MMISNKLVVGKMKDEVVVVVITEFVGLKVFCWKINVWGIQQNSKTFLSCFDDKIYILNNGYDGLAYVYQS